MNDRGEYFALYASFFDDPDVHALEHLAFRVLVTLKGALGAAGIGVVYDGVLAERCHCSIPELHAAYVELEARKESGGEGWIRRERNVVWLVNGLRYSPTLRASDRKHRTFVQRLLAPLGTRSIVAEFRARYADWFEPARSLFDAEPEGSSEGQARASEGSSEGHRSIKRSDGLSEAGSESLKRSDDVAPLVSPPPSARASGSPRLLDRPAIGAFLRVCYGEAPPARVLEELDQTLMERGAKLDAKERVRAFDVAHLEACCRAVADDPPRKRSVGMHFVLLKLRDTWLEAKAAAERSQHAPAKARGRGTPTPIGSIVAPAPDPVSDTDVEQYFATHVDEAHAIEQVVAQQFVGWPASSVALTKTRDAALKRALREAYETRDRAEVPA